MHFTLLLALGAAHALLLPAPPGPYSVSVQHAELIDTDRIDPFAPEANTPRRLMASAYLPIDARYNCTPQVVPYLPTITASVFGKQGEALGVPAGAVDKVTLEFCDISTVRLEPGRAPGKQFPVLVFSHGFQGSRLLHGAMSRSLASQGYIVLTLDHPYESFVVEYPDGSLAVAREGLKLEDTLGIRTGDVSFLISQLSNTTFVNSVFAGFTGTFDPERVVVAGHSLGGSTAAASAQRDPRIVGGINFDGPILGPVGQQGFRGKPFVQVASNNSVSLFPEWPGFYAKLDAAKMELAVRGTQHYAFMDVPLLLTIFEAPPEAQPTLEDVFGVLDGKTLEVAVNGIMTGLLELVFHNKTKPLRDLGGNPNIELLRSDLPKCR